MEPQINEAESVIAPLQKVTPISKYLALLLFIVLPFLGGWIGYNVAPEKVVEVEKIVFADKVTSEVPDATNENDNNEIQSAFSYIATKDGRDYYIGTTTIKGYLQSMEQEMDYDPSKVFHLWFVVDEEDYNKFIFREQAHTDKFQSRPLIEIKDLEQTAFYQSVLDKCAGEISKKEYCKGANATSSPMEITITNLSAVSLGSRGEIFSADLVEIAQ